MLIPVLALTLEEKYWTHVEHFCMHLPLPQKAMDDLILVFLHGMAGGFFESPIPDSVATVYPYVIDTLTSTLSTFPYHADDCKRYLDLLHASRGMYFHHTPTPFDLYYIR